MNNVGEVITSRKHLKAANELHLIYIDDLTLAEAINLKTELVKIPENTRILPPEFHDRTGHHLPAQKSKINLLLSKTSEYAVANDMEINFNKQISCYLIPAPLLTSTLE